MSNVMTKFTLCSEAEDVSDSAGLGHSVIPSQHVHRGLLCSPGIACSCKPEEEQALLPDLAPVTFQEVLQQCQQPTHAR